MEQGLKNNKLYYYFNKYFQNDFLKIITEKIDKSKKINIFDVGCYIGDFSINIKKVINKNVSFFLFDPNPNIKVKNFNINKIALDSTNKKKFFYLNDFLPHSGSSLKKITKDDFFWNLTRKMFLFKMNKQFKRIAVRTQTLDSFCSKNKILDIEVLKIDVEGNELEVLKGGKKILRKTNIIQLEILEKKKFFNAKFNIIIKFLKKYNFELIKNKNMWSVSIFSQIKGNDLLFIKKK
jgi:FkbM family methyltransferase